MRFPWTLTLGPVDLSAHVLFELAAYATAFLMFARERRKQGDVIASDARWWLHVAAILGAAVGSKVVHWLGDPAALLHREASIAAWMGGKSIVGGLLGGTLAVEWAKARLGIERRTGDALVLPLCVSMAIGRVGCFVSGLADDTYGVATGLPWGVDFGDGIARHPTQLYEVLFLAILALALARGRTRTWPEGLRFDAFLMAYLAFRIGIDFLKPYPRGVVSLGLAATQWFALAGLVWRCTWRARRDRRLVRELSS